VASARTRPGRRPNRSSHKRRRIADASEGEGERRAQAAGREAAAHPIDVKAAEREKPAEGSRRRGPKRSPPTTTLRKFARAYHAAHIEPIRATDHGQEWLKEHRRHVGARVLIRPIARNRDRSSDDVRCARWPTRLRGLSGLGTSSTRRDRKAAPDIPPADPQGSCASAPDVVTPASLQRCPTGIYRALLSDLRLRKGNACSLPRIHDSHCRAQRRGADGRVVRIRSAAAAPGPFRREDEKAVNRRRVPVRCVIKILEGQAGQAHAILFPRTLATTGR